VARLVASRISCFTPLHVGARSTGQALVVGHRGDIEPATTVLGCPGSRLLALAGTTSPGAGPSPLVRPATQGWRGATPGRACACCRWRSTTPRRVVPTNPRNSAKNFSNWPISSSLTWRMEAPTA